MYYFNELYFVDIFSIKFINYSPVEKMYIITGWIVFIL